MRKVVVFILKKNEYSELTNKVKKANIVNISNIVNIANITKIVNSK
jgi:hypothetical protein